ncbi:hypothetical protein C2E23DRAFT_422954 [Lenzites betulinus]|nr:hypothetical protein C2E23DRAFT_422954 [Lenzites betulinus]
MNGDCVALTVHHFLHRENEGEDATPDEVLFNDAAALVSAVDDEAIWHSPPNLDISNHALTGNAVQYAAKLPLYDEEEWTLDDLEDFDHAPFHRLLAEDDSRLDTIYPADGVDEHRLCVPVEHTPSPSLHSTGLKRKGEHADLSISSHKRPRLEEGSLFDALPRPHYCPSLMTFDDSWPPLLPPPHFANQFHPRPPTPIPPHTHASAEECIGDDFSRLAWIVPIRGRLPWEGATPALMMARPTEHDSSEGQTQTPEAIGTSPFSSIVWTRDALSAFWTFMKDVQDKGNLGPLSLAFYSSTSSAAAASSHYGSHEQASSAGLNPSFPQESILSMEAPRSTLCDMDYIKIYHDARYTRILRNLLNAWAYRTPGLRVRVLKAAALVLLDERSQGMLIC